MRHKFSFKEIAYDLVDNKKEFFCENCQELIATQKSPNDKIIYLAEFDRECAEEVE